ncbi:hypothetical protein B5V88_09245 [Heyndrickxia sporothermodurans]|nr:hypothetical protein B5V88_09245 [Heyndrickxia sporothermodurans]PTY87803.1 hypothetical protein B5V91_00790 [Heyndrickxia sporothermodurans]PTY91918.1 hypothetical protein B5V90_04420 [Heyndrickxia sporothermodurans]
MRKDGTIRVAAKYSNPKDMRRSKQISRSLRFNFALEGNDYQNKKGKLQLYLEDMEGYDK